MDIKLAALIWTEMVSAGIVPLTNEMINSEKQAKIEELLVSLPEGERLELKRKFRKMWRRQRRGKKARYLRLRTGLPSASQMRARKRAVWQKFYSEAYAVIVKHDPNYNVIAF